MSRKHRKKKQRAPQKPTRRPLAKPAAPPVLATSSRPRSLILLGSAAVILLGGASLISFLKDSPHRQTPGSSPLKTQSLVGLGLSTGESKIVTGAAGSFSPGGLRSEEDHAFWEDARVSDPAQPRQPTAASIPQPDHTLPVVDHASAVRELEQAGPAPTLNDHLILWFANEPVAATDWLNQTNRYVELDPALASLSESIANAGNPDLALQWADGISEDAIRENTALRIYGQQARAGRITREELQLHGLSEDKIDLILSGALTD